MDTDVKRPLEPWEDLIRRKKEAARRIIEMSGELNLTLLDLEDVGNIVRLSATLSPKTH